MQREYDFYTGITTKVTALGNTTGENVISETEYDALGRPLKAKSGVGTSLEIWSTTEYNDALRRVIVRSDIETKGDGKKIAVQHYDQLGRVRLTRQIENVATEDPTDEADGIKVQTRYQTGNPYSYQLSSNPYRAAKSSDATNEESMGWTRSKSINTGKHSEVETFTGATLPYPFLTSGDNTNSTGKVQTDVDADRTLVTDQSGKQRISKTNALGQLTDIWEIMAASDSSTVSVTFPSQSIANGYQTSYSYDTLNNLTTVNQGSQTRTFSYSSLSRLLTAANPESGTISYGYDNNGNLTNKTDARTVLTTYTYDNLNRVLTRSYLNEPSGQTATPNVTYSYDDTNIANAKGKLTKVITGTGSTSFSITEYTQFDLLGRVTKSKQTTDGTAYNEMLYSYNLSGALIEETYPSGRVVKNTFDNDGDLQQVQSKKANDTFRNYANSFNYTAAGAVSSMRLGNGLWENTSFNSRLQPTQIGLGSGATSQNLLKLNYDYGSTQNNGNVQSQTITVPTVGTNTGFTAIQTYTYDSLNRLKDAKEMMGTTETWKQTFTFDRYGNRNFDEANTTTLPKNCGTSPNSTVCAADRKVLNPSVNTANNRLSTSDDYTFDNSGNTTKDALNRKFTYDAENKQIKVETVNSGGTVTGTLGEYFYDGDGKRVKKVVPSGETTIFIYDASGKLVAEYSTVLATTPQVSYLTNDHLGSPRINTNENGAVTARHDYQPFGAEIATGQRITGLGYNSDEIRKKFTGYDRDTETELDFAQARMYANTLGRFTVVDPYKIILESKAESDKRKASEKLNNYLFTTQKWNRYAYCLNNPLVYIDPNGEDVVVAFTGGVFGGGKAVTDANDTTVKLVNAAEAEAKSRNIEFNGIAIAPGANVDSAVNTAYEFIKQNYKDGEALIIYGYSNGGDAAVELAEKLKADNIKVDLIITVDSTDGPLANSTVNNVIPDNVQANQNIYQTLNSGPSNSSGSHSSFPGSSGGPNFAEDPRKTLIKNNNVSGPQTNHANIDEQNLDSNIQSVKNFMSPKRP